MTFDKVHTFVTTCLLQEQLFIPWFDFRFSDKKLAAYTVDVIYLITLRFSANENSKLGDSF